MEDVRMGRLEIPLEFHVTVGAVATQIVPYDETRVSLILGSPASGSVTFGFDNLVTLVSGIIVVANQVPLQLTVQEFGRIVYGPIWGIHSVGGVAVSYWQSQLVTK
jgi:hypothetical protein